MAIVWAFLIVVASIAASFLVPLYSGASHQLAQHAAAAFGVASALCWGLSVVGYLIWTRIVVTLTHPLWNGCFNLFAAIAAAAAVAYATI